MSDKPDAAERAAVRWHGDDPLTIGGINAKSLASVIEHEQDAEGVARRIAMHAYPPPAITGGGKAARSLLDAVEEKRRNLEAVAVEIILQGRRDG